MLREVIKEAETIEEAKNLAAEALGMLGAELQFEILQLPQKRLWDCSEAVRKEFGHIIKSRLPSRRQNT